MAKAMTVVVAFCLLIITVVSTSTATGGSVPHPSLDYQTYRVIPKCNETDECKSNCHDLEFYASHTDNFFKSNATFTFISGTHHHETNLTVSNVTNLKFKAIEEGSVTIQCSQEHHVGFVFNECSHITFQNIVFYNCGQKINSPHSQMFLAAVAFIKCSYLTLDRIIINESTVQGLYVYGVQEFMKISGSKFIGAGYQHNQTNSDSNIAGNSIFAEYLDNFIETETLNISIDNLEFLSNNNRPKCADINKSDQYCKCDHLASGLSIILRRSGVLVSFTNLYFANNSGCRGGNLAIVFNTSSQFSGQVIFQNTSIENGIATYGGGLYIFYLSVPSYDRGNYCRSLENISTSELVTVMNTIFKGNKALSGGGLYARLTDSLAICNPIKISITENCLFERNTLSNAGYGGVAIHSVNFISFEYIRQTVPQFFLYICQSIFRNHAYSSHSKWNNSGSGVIYIKTSHHTSIENIYVYNNQYSGIVIVDSNLVLSGSIEICNNNGSSGGGMLFCSNSIMFLTPNTTVTIANNQVEHAGGGICVEDQCLQSKPACFFQPDYEASVHPKLNSTIKIHLINNSAKYAGDQIYGGSIDFCYIMDSPFHNVSLHEGDSVDAYHLLFIIEPNESFSVTSPQRRICLCNGNGDETMERNCSITDQPSIYPGDSYNPSVAVVGQLDGIVPGTVYAELKEINNKVIQSLEPGQIVQKTTGKKCATLSYTVNTNYHSATLVLSVQFVGDKSFAEHLKLFEPLEIDIAIMNCPLGFHIINSSCHCLRPLEIGFDCYIGNKAIVPHSGHWIGYSQKFYNDSIILYSTGCTVDYCKNTHPENQPNITSELTKFSNQDEQCQFSRTGILCGACPTNFSVILGSSDCRSNCSNLSLLLIPLFAVMGIILVLLLLILNMTVTEGTINGLLFYANVVQISNRIFFGIQNVPFLTYLLRGFIAWLNLDFGVSTCLYHGMDDYAKAWLQFAFPLYIWLITGVIIFLSRHFTFVARMVNKNGVKVLATLILMSYAKMVRASIVAVHFKELHHTDSNGSIDNITLCWYSDCNIQYMKGRHIPLGVAGFISGLCLLPFAFLLLFTDLLSKVSFFSCMWKLKPFLDAYTGPYANQGRYWTGLLLVVRLGLFIASSFNHSTGDTSLNVTLANIVMVFLIILPWLLQTHIYSKRWLNALECSFLLNLGFLVTGTQYLLFFHKHTLQIWLTDLSVGFAFITFILIILYHIYQHKSVRLVKHKIVDTCCQRKASAMSDDFFNDSGSQTSDSDDDLLRQFPPVVRFDRDREPLLS